MFFEVIEIIQEFFLSGSVVVGYNEPFIHSMP